VRALVGVQCAHSYASARRGNSLLESIARVDPCRAEQHHELGDAHTGAGVAVVPKGQGTRADDVHETLVFYTAPSPCPYTQKEGSVKASPP
jgi:hypothetical protein